MSPPSYKTIKLRLNPEWLDSFHKKEFYDINPNVSLFLESSSV